MLRGHFSGLCGDSVNIPIHAWTIIVTLIEYPSSCMYVYILPIWYLCFHITSVISLLLLPLSLKLFVSVLEPFSLLTLTFPSLSVVSEFRCWNCNDCVVAVVEMGPPRAFSVAMILPTTAAVAPSQCTSAMNVHRCVCVCMCVWERGMLVLIDPPYYPEVINICNVKKKQCQWGMARIVTLPTYTCDSNAWLGIAMYTRK